MSRTPTMVEDHSLGNSKRSLLYSKQKNFKKQPQVTSSPSPHRFSKTPTDPKCQTMRTFKAELKLDHTRSNEDFNSLKSENKALLKENESLKLQNETLKTTLNGLKMHNSDLVHMLVDTIEGIVTISNWSSGIKKKIILEIKTTLVNKLEELKFCEGDFKKQIERVSLWGKSEVLKENQEKTTRKNAESILHPLNPLKNVMVEAQQAVALYDFPGEMEGDLEFKKGQVIQILGKSDSGWWMGKIDGTIGAFPCNFVEITENPETS